MVVSRRVNTARGQLLVSRLADVRLVVGRQHVCLVGGKRAFKVTGAVVNRRANISSRGQLVVSSLADVQGASSQG